MLLRWALLLLVAAAPVAQGQYNPSWGPSPCPGGMCVPKWDPTYNVSPSVEILHIAGESQ